MGIIRDWQPIFLAALAEVPVVTRACRVADITAPAAYNARRRDPEFAKAWDSAVEEGIDVAEQEAFRRAVQGVSKGVWHHGQLVGKEIVYSDSLMSLILRGRRKQLYAERTEVTGPDGKPQQSQILIATGVPREDDFSDLA